MKVLHVTLHLGGGLATAITQYVDALPEMSHSLASASVGWESTPLDRSHLTRVVDLTGNASHAWLRLLDVVMSGKYDVVHAHSSHAGAFLRLMPVSVPIVYTPHALATLAPRWSLQWAAGQSERLLGIRRAVIAASCEDEAVRMKRLSPRSPVFRIINRPTIDVAARSQLGRPISIIGSGRLIRQKDPRFFAAIARIARDRGYPYSFIWIGGGAQHERTMLESAGVSVSGWLTSQDFVASLAGHAVYIHSAIFESAAFAVLDAAANGLPIIGRRVPGMAELSWIRHVSNPADAVDMLPALCEPTAWARAAEQSIAGAQLFTRATQRAQLLRAYEAALHSKPCRGR